MITPEAAWQRVVETTAPSAAVTRPYLDSQHYYLAEPVCADRDIPAANRAAMDGFAVRAADTQSTPASLCIIGEVAAGSDAVPHLRPGTCARILTGANVPPGADAVVRVEDTTETAEHATILVAANPGQHILRRAENATAGESLLSAGTRLHPGALALCAAVGCAEPSVYPLSTIAIVTTGSELKKASDSVEPHQIRDANGPAILTTLRAHGFAAPGWQSVPDDLPQLTEAIGQALQDHRVVLVSGGVSVGKYDFVPEVVKDLGGTIQYHGIAIKPGKPQLYATFPNGSLLFGLPGNPLAVLTGLHEFVLPALRRLSGCPEDACRPLLRLPLRTDLQIKGKRRHFQIARLITDAQGTTVEPIPNTGSSDFVSGCQAEGMILLPEGNPPLTAGTLVDFRPWRPL